MEKIKEIFCAVGELYKAMHIVNEIFSKKRKNYHEVTKLINITFNKSLSIEIIEQFVEQLLIYPTMYGFDAIQSHAKFKEQIRQTCRENDIPTSILSPKVSKCQNCDSKDRLETKTVKFNKESVLIGVTCIG